MELLGPYDSKNVEDKIYKLWEDSGFFNPDNLPKRHRKPFSIVLPPPNVTGVLHMGSALMVTVEDIMIRFERMRGKKTLWIPGTDHAAIATETKFLKEKKLSRNDFNGKREEFFKLVDQFATENRDVMLNQMRKMGASLDWSRLAYTLDEKRTKAVKGAFLRMHSAGLIYAGERVINWDTKGQTTVSDVEIDHETQKATLYTFKYSKDFPIAIATTRPETKVGDTAVAVNPSDERYQQYIGQTFNVEFAGVTLNIKVIADKEVDPAFGTGALGVTPAHSLIDADMAMRNNLPSIQVINEFGKMNDKAGALVAGKKTLEAREIIVNYLKEHNLIEKEEIIDQNIAKSSRSGGIIEPLPKRHQFFINVNKPIKERGNKTLKELMREVIVKKKIDILPERFEKIYLNWVENLRDWNISRQIWYGHAIPDAWYKGEEVKISAEKPGEDWQRIEDTLDTWFSSGLWTFSTLGWPEKTADLKMFHPTSVVESGYDILTFWISRMILMSQFLLGDVPFKTVYLHGLVRDEQNRKISKSLGNNIDPLDMISQYGADAVRMAMIIGTSVGNDSKISQEKFKAYKNFANKIWNASKFVQMNTQDFDPKAKIKLSADQKKNLKELEKLAKETTKLMDGFKFYIAGENMYHYFWHTFCDKIIEESKSALASPEPSVKAGTQYMLLEILSTSLKLMHPFMPFITEEIWQQMGNKSLLMIEEWPA
ncbi:MAG: valine--tRNA ligase [Candidatus Staskawiczbacteria bacterium]|nr:valine--tRNA ligase [Candidatus Staskawiczbacteria bacterium]